MGQAQKAGSTNRATRASGAGAARSVDGLMRFFRVAPFDAGVFLTTIIFIGVMLFFGVRSMLAFAAGHDPDSFDLGASLLLAGLIGYSLVRSIKGYSLGDGELVIDRTGPGKMHFAIDNIATAEIGEDLGRFVRANYLSTQGLFGWTGKVHVRKPSDPQSLLIDVYGTNPANAVILTLKDEQKMILTPRDVPGFLEALREMGVTDRQAAPKKSYLPPARKKKSKR